MTEILLDIADFNTALPALKGVKKALSKFPDFSMPIKRIALADLEGRAWPSD